MPCNNPDHHHDGPEQTVQEDVKLIVDQMIDDERTEFEDDRYVITLMEQGDRIAAVVTVKSDDPARERGEEDEEIDALAERLAAQLSKEIGSVFEVIQHPKYFDRQGNEIDHDRWMELSEDDAYNLISQTRIFPYLVSTIWIGHDLAIPTTDVPEDRELYETKVFLDFEAILGPKPETREEADRMWAEGQEKVMALWAGLHEEVADWDGVQVRTGTEAKAIEAHDDVCIQIRRTIANVEMAEQLKEQAALEQSAR